MDRDTFNALVEQTYRDTACLLVKKGAEYSDDTDRLSNFKQVAEQIGVTPLQVASVYAGKHWIAIQTYVRKNAGAEQQVLSEPIEGRFDDLINYCYLMKGLIQEEREVKERGLRLEINSPTDLKKFL